METIAVIAVLSAIAAVWYFRQSDKKASGTKGSKADGKDKKVL